LPANVRLYGVDSSPEMVQAAMQRLGDSPHDVRFEALRAEEMVLDAASVSVALCNYTLQFVDPELRIPILQNIRQALHPGGFFVLSEKLTHADPATAAFMIEHYHAYKRRAGYSDTEIQQKDTALQGVLRPWTLEQWQRAFAAAGFSEARQLATCSSLGECHSGYARCRSGCGEYASSNSGWVGG
jgi:tRNA (cmo5U34)-methyltransferase